MKFSEERRLLGCCAMKTSNHTNLLKSRNALTIWLWSVEHNIAAGLALNLAGECSALKNQFIILNHHPQSPESQVL